MSSVTALVLWSAAAFVGQTGPTEELSWGTKYNEALQQGRALGKPVLIVIDDPAESTRSVRQISHQPQRREATLLDSYVRVHFDVNTELGQKVARAFKVSQFPYTVVVDKTATRIMHRRTGQFSAGEWEAMLARYRHGTYVVRRYVAPAPVYCRG